MRFCPRTITLPAAICAIVGALLTPAKAPAAGDAGALVIVVNKSTFTMMLSTKEAKQMYLGERLRWPDGKKVVTVLPPADGPEFGTVLKVIIGMSEGEYKRFLMQASFTGKDVTPPRLLNNAAAIKQFVASTPGAVGCIRANEADDSVRAVKLDGAAPGDAAYKLTISQSGKHQGE